MKRPPISSGQAPVQAPAPRTHRAFRFLFGSWSLTGLVMVAASIAALLLVTGCGGGGTPEPNATVLLATSTSTAQGGDNTRAAPLVAAPLLGPTLNLAEPTSVAVELHTTWVQQFTRTADLAFSITPGTAAAPPSAATSAGLGQPPSGGFTATSTWCLHLPAGQHRVTAVARLRAFNSAGAPSAALGMLDVTAQWQVSAVHPSTCSGVL
jgi:hypothetical protein